MTLGVSTRVLFGFHAVGARVKAAPETVLEVFFETQRRDERMQNFLSRVRSAGVKLFEVEADRLQRLCGHTRHQGVVARVAPRRAVKSLDDWLDQVEGPPLLLVLDGVTDPHNLGACLRVADGAGVHAVIAPKDHAVGINATVAKVASGAAETVPYFMVTNLSRTLGELKERGIWVLGTADDVATTVFEADWGQPVALVVGAEGRGMRHLTRKKCDQLLKIPMAGAVESLNLAVASGVCLYEAVRQRRTT